MSVRAGTMNATIALGLLLSASACQRAKQEPLGPEYAQFALDRLPETATRTRFDFGGKVQLIGYEVDPPRNVLPGQTIDVKLYWTSSGDLSPGWLLFTHLVNDRGVIIGNYDQSGPLREPSGDGPPLLAPPKWRPGKVYVDRLTVQVPSPSNRPVTDRVTLVAGLWRGQMRLDVRSGPEIEEAAVISHFRTGVVPKAPSNATP